MWGISQLRGTGTKAPRAISEEALFVQLKYRSLKITVNAALQRQFHSPFIFREEDPSRQVSPGESFTLRGAGEIAQPVKYLLYKPEDLSFIFKTCRNKPGAAVCNPSILEILEMETGP